MFWPLHYFSAFVFICFRLTKGRITFLRSEIIIASFLLLTGLFCRIINRAYPEITSNKKRITFDWFLVTFYILCALYVDCLNKVHKKYITHFEILFYKFQAITFNASNIFVRTCISIMKSVHSTSYIRKYPVWFNLKIFECTNKKYLQ